MTSRKTYCIEPQRLIAGSGYVLCQPHAACRFVIVETTKVPSTHGRKTYSIKRNYHIFSGRGAEARAQQLVDRLCRRQQPSDTFRGRKIWGRSLTTVEYDEVMRRRNPLGSY